MARKSSPFGDDSRADSYRTVDSARNEPICSVPVNMPKHKGQNARIAKKISGRIPSKGLAFEWEVAILGETVQVTHHSLKGKKDHEDQLPLQRHRQQHQQGPLRAARQRHAREVLDGPRRC